MAVLTDVEFTRFKRYIRRDKTARDTLAAENLAKADWQAAFQALEDGYNSRRVAIKLEIDVAAGKTISNNSAKVLEDAWMDWKATT